MFYIRKNKKIDEVILKTFCEQEEDSYEHVGRVYIQKKKRNMLFFLMMAFLFLYGISLNAHSFHLKHIDCTWDGAGDTWTCGNCGSSNYKWQMSCSNCGAFQ